jgi:multidrug efflux pump subunit AcrA (membrane-fusion protein)
MKRLIFTLLIGFLLLPTGCKGNSDLQHAHELPGFSVTKWGNETELFMEHRAIVAGRETSFAVHMTDLKTFKAVTSGRVVLLFKGSDGKEDRFVAEGVTSPGIFRPIARISSPGQYTLSLIVESPEANDRYNLGEVRVFKDEHEAAHAVPHEEGEAGISFLKEQQWKADFRVEEVAQKELSATLKTYGQVIAPLKSYTFVTAPVAGSLESGIKGPSLFRAFVRKGEKLGTVKAVSGETFDVLSPVSGIATRVHLSEDVAQGSKLFDIMDLAVVWVEASVYEPDISKVVGAKEAFVEVPGTETRISTSRLVGEGGVFNASSRTLPVIFEVENKDESLRVGSAVTVYIKTSDRFKGPAVPRSALVDDGGRFVVYVQPEGESFEPREVVPAVEEGDWVGISSGLESGERVVTKGAYLMKLASSSSQVPAHGHAH